MDSNFLLVITTVDACSAAVQELLYKLTQGLVSACSNGFHDCPLRRWTASTVVGPASEWCGRKRSRFPPNEGLT